MSTLWFRAKRYGYGWYPSTWQGWLVIFIFLCLILVPLSVIPETEQHSNRFVAVYLPYVFVLVVILLWICVKKGEPARWRWGK